MAIQAQYPSNILLLNRNLQEGKSPHGGGGGKGKGEGEGGGGQFGDQTYTSFNYGVVGGGTNNSRKRGRETTIMPDSPLMSSQQPQQLIDLGKLYTSQQKNGVCVSTGLGLTLNDQQLHQQQKYSVSPQRSSHSSVLHHQSLISDDLATQIKQQIDEIDQFMLLQGEQLRRGLAEKRQRHYHTLINAAEETLSRRLREKEAEVGKALRRNAELEAKANQFSLEAQAWQARARMQENYTATLQLQLQQAIIAGGGKSGVHVQDVDEYGGGEGSSAGEAEDAESAYIDPDRVVVSSGPICKSCRKRVASMVLLPCRHMCLCMECDGVAQACPACLTVRSSSIEVCFS